MQPTDDARPKLTSLRMFLTVFTVVQCVAVGVVVFSVNKMRLAVVRDPAAPYLFLGFTVVVLGLVLLTMRSAMRVVRQSKADEADVFARYTSEVLIRAFSLNLPAVILVAGYVLTATEWLLVPAAVGLIVVWFTRPTLRQYERWRALVGVN